MIKKIFVVFCLLFMHFSFSILAKEQNLVNGFEVKGEFYSYLQAPEKVSQILGMTRKELDD